jgi:hypothetical protein
MIDPCGIKDRGVGSIKQILQKASHGTEIYDTLLMDMAYNSMIKEFAEIFQLDLDTSPDCSFQVKKKSQPTALCFILNTRCLLQPSVLNMPCSLHFNFVYFWSGFLSCLLSLWGTSICGIMTEHFLYGTMDTLMLPFEPHPLLLFQLAPPNLDSICFLLSSCHLSVTNCICVIFGRNNVSISERWY